MICDDTLGGLTAIDARKFADEFLKRRRGDKDDAGGVSSASSRSLSASPMSGMDSSSNIMALMLKTPSIQTDLDFDTGNRFVIVGQKKKSKGKK